MAFVAAAHAQLDDLMSIFQKVAASYGNLNAAAAIFVVPRSCSTGNRQAACGARRWLC